MDLEFEMINVTFNFQNLWLSQNKLIIRYSTQGILAELPEFNIDQFDKNIDEKKT